MTFTLFPLKQLERTLTEMLFPPYVTAAIVSVGGLLKQKNIFFSPGHRQREFATAVYPPLLLCHVSHSCHSGQEYLHTFVSDRLVFNYLLGSNSLYRVLYLLCVTPHKLQRAPPPRGVVSCCSGLAPGCSPSHYPYYTFAAEQARAALTWRRYQYGNKGLLVRSLGDTRASIVISPQQRRCG